MDEDLPAKIGGTFEARGKRCGIADGPKGITQQFMCYSVRGELPGIADGDIGFAGPQIDDGVGTDHFEGRIGTQLPPAGQAWDEPAASKRIGRRDAKRLLVAIAFDGGDSRGECFQAVADDWKEAGSGVSQRERPWPAAEQGSPTIALQQSDLMADRGWRYAEFGCRLVEAQVPCGGVEGSQLYQGR
jgi:hypothetical protein